MIDKILKIELLALFFLSVVNLVFFYFQDSLPDNLLQISSTQDQISLLSYYLTSFLVIISYFSGIWVVVPFLVFAVLYAFVFSKRNQFIDLFSIFFLCIFCMLISYWGPSYFGGDGWRTVIKNLWSTWEIIGLSAFFLFLFILGCWSAEIRQRFFYWRNGRIANYSKSSRKEKSIEETEDINWTNKVEKNASSKEALNISSIPSSEFENHDKSSIRNKKLKTGISGLINAHKYISLKCVLKAIKSSSYMSLLFSKIANKFIKVREIIRLFGQWPIQKIRRKFKKRSGSRSDLRPRLIAPSAYSSTRTYPLLIPEKFEDVPIGSKYDAGELVVENFQDQDDSAHETLATKGAETDHNSLKNCHETKDKDENVNHPPKIIKHSKRNNSNDHSNGINRINGNNCTNINNNYDLIRRDLIDCIRSTDRPETSPTLSASSSSYLSSESDPPPIPSEGANSSTLSHNEIREQEIYFQKVVHCLEEKFKEFKIDARIVNILNGPVVNTFELELGAGVRISKITAITEDLALALHGVPIRIIYPMKGRPTIGIEIPHNTRRVIYLDEILSSDTFINSGSVLPHKLPLALGINTFGKVFVVDLASGPHLLIAGSTGSGKSVFINSLLVSLLVKMSPQKMKLILIDPKQLELAPYATLPHLILPVITGAKQAAFSLMWAIQEMERRYLILREFEVRNIDGFNEKLKSVPASAISKIERYYSTLLEDNTYGSSSSSYASGKESKNQLALYELPYIVIIIDEFADLILGPKGKEIELSICRLAAKARAAGIHLIMATQRPSVDVITGLIKSNFPTRVSFRVSSGIDSRTILNSMGAEKLLGHGDMLYRNGVEVDRLHSAYISENGIGAMVKKLSVHGLVPTYDKMAVEYLDTLDKTKGGSGDFDYDGLASWVDQNRADGDQLQSDYQHGNSHVHGRDEYAWSSDEDIFREAIRILSDEKQVSVSMLQRRLRIGFNRAATLVELLESKGIVGPAMGAKPREVYLDKIKEQ